MQDYARLLRSRKRRMLVKYAIVKSFIGLLLLLYFWYLSSLLNPVIWELAFKFFLLFRNLLIIIAIILVYSLVYTAVVLGKGYYPRDAYYISVGVIASLVGLSKSFVPDPTTFFKSVLGGLDLITLLVSFVSILYVVSIIITLGFIVRGSLSQFMWGIAISLFSIVSLLALGYANLVVYEWPPTSLSEIVNNSIVRIAAFTFFIIEVGGNLAYAAMVMDDYMRKIERISNMLESMLVGKVQSQAKEEIEPIAGEVLKLTPLAQVLLRGYTGIYALEETSEELSSKIMGFIRTEIHRDQKLVRSVLGLGSEPEIKTIFLSILTGLFIKLPLSIFLAYVALVLTTVLGSLFPGVVEIESPAFALFVVVLMLVAIYMLGALLVRRRLS